MKHSACMKLLSDLIDGETITITNSSTNARMWSALHGVCQVSTASTWAYACLLPSVSRSPFFPCV